MSNPNDPGLSNQPDNDEVENLSADDLDVQELDDQLLEEAAGGFQFADSDQQPLAACTSHCNNNVC